MKKITKIVTFYDDGTFTESTPSPYLPTQPTPIWPINPIPPYPWSPPAWPNMPPYSPGSPLYTVTCVGADGTKFEQTVGPAYATGTTNAPQTKETKE
jgi:hypothetical protein